MAEIPVQRKSGIPWWVWLLLALIVLGLLIWWATDNDEVDTAYVEPAPVAGPVAPVTTADTGTTGPITDISTLLGMSDRSALAGREVQLSGVQVQSVVGDRTFFVGPNAEQTVLVVLNQAPTPGQPGTEGRFDVTQGQTININGVMRNVDDPVFAGQPIEGLPAGTNSVIHAQSLDIVQRP